MNSTLLKLRKPLIAVQLLAAAAMLIGSLTATIAMSTGDGSPETFFGGVTAARIGAIAAFCAAAGVFIATYLNKLPKAGAAAGAVISLIGFVINFILIPASSFEGVYRAGGIELWQGFMVLALLLLGIVLAVMSVVGLARKPRVNNQN